MLVKLVEELLSLDKKLDEIRELGRKGNEAAAFIEMDKLVNLYPNEASVWSLRSTLYSAVKNYEEAITSINKSIELSPEESRFYYQRGRCNFKFDNSREAVRDLSDALHKYTRNDISLIQYMHFYRAESFIKLGRKHEALADIAYIPDDFQIWTFKLRSKADLIADCDKL